MLPRSFLLVFLSTTLICASGLQQRGYYDSIAARDFAHVYELDARGYDSLAARWDAAAVNQFSTRELVDELDRRGKLIDGIKKYILKETPGGPYQRLGPFQCPVPKCGQEFMKLDEFKAHMAWHGIAEAVSG